MALDDVVLSTATDVTPPSPPTGLTAAVVGSNHVNLTWTPATDQSGQGWLTAGIALAHEWTMGSFLSSPVVSRGVVYCASMDGTLYALTSAKSP